MRLREYRTKSILTMNELAERVGVSRHTIWKWEKGLSIPHARHKRKLSSVLHIPKDEIAQVFTSAEK